MAPRSDPVFTFERYFANVLSEATTLASLSPSSHNCQPWGLARASTAEARDAAATFLNIEDTDGLEYLVLALDRRHELAALPAHATEMYLSCGAYGRMLLRYLASRGWQPVRTRTPEHAQHPTFGTILPPSWSVLCVSALRYVNTSEEEPAELRAMAEARRTNRGAYRSVGPNAAVLDTLAQPTPPDRESDQDESVNVRHITDDGEKEALARLLAERGGRDFSHGPAWRETHSYLRRSPAHARTTGDGFSFTQLFGPMSALQRTGKRLALSPWTMRYLCRIGYHNRLAKQLAYTVRSTPTLVAMGFSSTSTPELAAALRGGERLADYWLEATSAGLALHPISVLLQHDDLRHELQARLGLPGRTFFLSRLGHPESHVPPTDRRADSATHRVI